MWVHVSHGYHTLSTICSYAYVYLPLLVQTLHGMSVPPVYRYCM